ncbi:hypothetical protein KKC17_01540 [Patescibacteria group bacterium]|nr:hypothetical protein [Patescibacteria group bacterium]
MIKDLLFKPSGFSRWLNLIIIGLFLLLSAFFVWQFLRPADNQSWSPDSYVSLADSPVVEKVIGPIVLSESCLVKNPCPIKIKAIDPEGDKLVYHFYSLPNDDLMIKPVEADSGETIAPALIFNKPGEIIFKVLVQDEAGHAAPEQSLVALVKEN